jgi:Secretion system C-terminal sorting domain
MDSSGMKALPEFPKEIDIYNGNQLVYTKIFNGKNSILTGSIEFNVDNENLAYLKPMIKFVDKNGKNVGINFNTIENIITPESTEKINSLETLTTPLNFILSQNYPNPFNPTTKINYTIPNDGFVSLMVYNILGQQVAEIVNTFEQSGKYSVNFDGSKLGSGIYFYRLIVDSFGKAGENSMTKKMILLK